LEPVSTAIQVSNVSPLVISTIAEQHNTSDTSITHHVSGPSTTMFSYAPPLLIPAVISTIAEYHNARDMSITHHVSEPSPVTTAKFSGALGPLPLIPATFHTSFLSSASVHRLLTTTVFAPRSLYESPMSAHLDPMIKPFTPSRGTQQFANSRLPKLTLPGDPLT